VFTDLRLGGPAYTTGLVSPYDVGGSVKPTA